MWLSLYIALFCECVSKKHVEAAAGQFIAITNYDARI